MAWLVTEGRVLASCESPTDRRSRGRGLLGRDGIEGAMVLISCRWVHTMGMRFALDVAYLDEKGVVVKTVHMQPASRRRTGVAGAVGDRGRGRRVRAMGPARRRRRGDARVTGALVLVAPRSATSATCRPVPSRRCSTCVADPAARTPGTAASCCRTPASAVCGSPSANEHTEAAAPTRCSALLAGGDDVAVITDAGTPGISDPGQRLVRAVVEAGHAVRPCPGPAAFVMALVRQRLRHHPVRLRGVPARAAAASAPSAWPRSPTSGARRCSTRRRIASNAP